MKAKKYGLLLAIIATATTLQGSDTHFGVKFGKNEHIEFAAYSGNSRYIKYIFLGYTVNRCEAGKKTDCIEAIKRLSSLINKNEFFCEVFWRVNQMDKYKALLKNLEERNAQIEELENLPPEDRITPADIRTIFRKVKPPTSPYGFYIDDPFHWPLVEAYCPKTGEIHEEFLLLEDVKEILRCKAFKVNKSRPECQYWSDLLEKARHTIKDDQKLVDKLQRFSSLREY